jgi:phospholipid transport system substrate-binding protein
MTIAMAAAVVAPRPVAAAESPTEFIGILGTQGLEVIRSSTTLAQKADYFHQVLRQDFDLPGLSRFVLGPYWRVANEAQQQEFRSLLEDYIVRVDGQRFAQYGGETFKVIGSRPDPAGSS